MQSAIAGRCQLDSEKSGAARKTAPARAAARNGHRGAALSVGTTVWVGGLGARRSTPPGGVRLELRRSTSGQLNDEGLVLSVARRWYALPPGAAGAGGAASVAGSADGALWALPSGSSSVSSTTG